MSRHPLAAEAGLGPPRGLARERHAIDLLQRDVLEAVALSRPLQVVMDLLCRRVEALAPEVICTVLADLFVTSSLCIALARAHDAGGHNARAAALQALRGALSNPLPWAIALGALASVTGLRPPGPLDTVIRMLADAASPVALFTIGAVLWRAGQHAHTRTPPGLYWPVALIKLLLHPALIWGLGHLAQRLGAPLTDFQLVVLTLAAALPSASNVSLLAERYGADNGRVARIILASTALAFVSFSTLAWLLRPQ